MLPWDVELSGRIERRVIDSPALRGNPLGDPHQRPLWVYVPPGYDDTDEHYPTVYVIQGITAHVGTWANRTAFRQPFIETADAVFADGAPPCIVVYVDAWTAYGGSQFVDSVGTGSYHTYLCDDVVGWVDRHYRTIPHRDSRAITGKSSGGFGALITPMLRPDVFGALASHAGDTLYDITFVASVGPAVRALRAYDHGIEAWWRDFHDRTSMSKPEDTILLVFYAISACFSPDADGRPRLPFDPRTGALVNEQWQRWLAWDPVRMIDDHAADLLSLRAVWLDAGSRDEYYLDLGAQAFRDGLDRIGVPADRVHFELFDAAHGAIDYRYPLALRWLAERLAR